MNLVDSNYNENRVVISSPSLTWKKDNNNLVFQEGTKSVFKNTQLPVYVAIKNSVDNYLPLTESNPFDGKVNIDTLFGIHILDKMFGFYELNVILPTYRYIDSHNNMIDINGSISGYVLNGIMGENFSVKYNGEDINTLTINEDGFENTSTKRLMYKPIENISQGEQEETSKTLHTYGNVANGFYGTVGDKEVFVTRSDSEGSYIYTYVNESGEDVPYNGEIGTVNPYIVLNMTNGDKVYIDANEKYITIDSGGTLVASDGYGEDAEIEIDGENPNNFGFRLVDGYLYITNTYDEGGLKLFIDNDNDNVTEEQNLDYPVNKNTINYSSILSSFNKKYDNELELIVYKTTSSTFINLPSDTKYYVKLPDKYDGELFYITKYQKSNSIYQPTYYAYSQKISTKIPNIEVNFTDKTAKLSELSNILKTQDFTFSVYKFVTVDTANTREILDVLAVEPKGDDTITITLPNEVTSGDKLSFDIVDYFNVTYHNITPLSPSNEDSDNDVDDDYEREEHDSSHGRD